MDFLPVLGLNIIITVLRMDIVQGAPSSPGVAPIPPDQLYKQFLLEINKPGCKPTRIKNLASFSKCMEGKDALLDYGCRYYNVLQPYCYCCGQICSYVEHGDICTKFCLQGSGSGVGHEAIIDLPFNWGSDPRCTEIGGKGSTTLSKKSDDLKFEKVNVTHVVDRRKDGKMPAKSAPPIIKPDCMGNNCPMEPSTVITLLVDSSKDAEIPNKASPPKIEPDCMGNNCPTDTPKVITPWLPSSIVPDCLGGNCPEQVITRKRKKRKEYSGPVWY